MEVFAIVTMHSAEDSYSFTFGFPIGITGPTTHVLSSKMLDGLSASVDKLNISFGNKVYLKFDMKNPALCGIITRSSIPTTPAPMVHVRVDISKNSGIPLYQLYNKTWVVDKLRLGAHSIIDQLDI